MDLDWIGSFQLNPFHTLTLPLPSPTLICRRRSASADQLQTVQGSWVLSRPRAIWHSELRLDGTSSHANSSRFGGGDSERGNVNVGRCDDERRDDNPIPWEWSERITLELRYLMVRRGSFYLYLYPTVIKLPG